MSRSGYIEGEGDAEEQWAMIRWRGAVKAATKGKRGQALLSEMAAALDAMPVKRLIVNELISKDGEVCALGAVAKHKALNVEGLDPDCYEAVAGTFHVAEALVREIAYENDEGGDDETPEERWARIRKWVAESLTPLPLNGQTGETRNK